VRGHVATLIADAEERERRRQANTDRVLRWLRLNTWSTADVLRQVIGVESRQAAHALLQRLCRDELIRKAAIVGEYGPPILIWGITAHGAAIAAQDNESISTRTFQPSKVKPATMGHSLDVQRLQLRAENAGWIWQPGIGEFSRSEAKYPDAVAIRPDGRKVAIEIERTVKTVKRYAEILVAHLEARKQGKWDWIYYFSESDAVRDRVRRAFQEVKRAKWHGQAIEVTDAHRAPFRFFTYGEQWI